MRELLKPTAAILVALTWFAQPADAGLDSTRGSSGTGTCVNESNPAFDLNTTYCYGTMAGIRNQTSDSGRFALFSVGTAGTLLFTMRVNGVGYSCTAPSSMTEIWRAAVASPNQYFWISLDRSTGVCKSLTLNGGSHYR